MSYINQVDSKEIEKCILNNTSQDFNIEKLKTVVKYVPSDLFEVEGIKKLDYAKIAKVFATDFAIYAEFNGKPTSVEQEVFKDMMHNKFGEQWQMDYKLNQSQQQNADEKNF